MIQQEMHLIQDDLWLQNYILNKRLCQETLTSNLDLAKKKKKSYKNLGHGENCHNNAQTCTPLGTAC